MRNMGVLSLMNAQGASIPPSAASAVIAVQPAEQVELAVAPPPSSADRGEVSSVRPLGVTQTEAAAMGVLTMMNNMGRQDSLVAEQLAEVT